MRIVKSTQERKKEILDVAEQLFAEKGFDRASTNDIIARIGIARGTLYHHFASKEEILDALVERLTQEGLERAKIIIADQTMSLHQRLTQAILALNIRSEAKAEVFEQIHKPQNALLHQKMQERLLSGVVPLLTKLIEEGNKSHLFAARYPSDAAEMIMIYSSIAFDENAGLSPEVLGRKKSAFIYHTERILGAAEGSFETAIMAIFNQ